MKNLIFLSFVTVFLSCNEEKEMEALPEEPLYYEQALNYLDEQKTDSAFLMFSKAKDWYLGIDDSLGVANCFIQMAITQREQGDFFGAQETSLQALEYLDQADPSHRIYLSTNYNNLATATDNTKEYEKAMNFYKLAIKFSDDTSNTFIYKNNLAISYQHFDKHSEALGIFEDMIDKGDESPKQYARVLSNYAKAKWEKDPSYNAAPELLRALLIRKQEHDLWGQNASYAHLSDYYVTKDLDSSLFYAKKQYAVAVKIKRADDQIKALRRLIKLSSNDSTKHYFETYQQLNDSVQNARAAARNQFALIRYEVEKNKTENLRLEKDNAEKANRLTRQRFMTGGVTLLLLIASLGGSLYYRRRKQRLQLEAQNQIKEHQLKTSRKVHDVVANGLYRLMTEIDYREEIDRENVLDRLEDMYEKSRDISYEVVAKQPVNIGYHEQIADMLKSFANESRHIFIAGNDAEVWHSISSKAKFEMEHVLQELMVNMRKHSQASDVVIRFERLGDVLHMYYKDNGVGVDKSIGHGNGLTNTGNRIKSLGGQITFVSDTGKGFQVDISVPVA